MTVDQLVEQNAKMIEHRIVMGKTQQLTADWTISATEVLPAEYIVGTVPRLLQIVFKWGRFGRWIDAKTYRLRKRLGWVSIEEMLMDSLTAEIEREINAEIMRKIFEESR